MWILPVAEAKNKMAFVRELPAPSLEVIPPEKDADEHQLLEDFLSPSHEYLSWKPKTEMMQRPSEHSSVCKFPPMLLKRHVDVNDNRSLAIYTNLLLKSLVEISKWSIF